MGGDPNQPTGLTGQARFDDLLAHAPKGEGYQMWILSALEDPNDIEYTRLLRAEKERVRHMAIPSVEEVNPGGTTSRMWERMGETAKDEKPRMDEQAPSAGRPVGENAPPTVGDQKQLQRAQKEIGTKSDKPLTNYYQQEPIVKGAPLTVGEIISGDMEKGGVSPAPGEPSKDPLLDEFAKQKGLSLSRPAEEALVRTGEYVYVGTEKDKFGFERPVYVYKVDAEASMAKWGPDRIKSYQHRLGLPETGIAEGDLKSLWDYAVKVAGMYAQTGQKVELQFIFDSLVNSAEAELKKKKRGGGGGGAGMGGAGFNENDYYMAMMQVLGDISGVQEGAIGG